MSRTPVPAYLSNHADDLTKLQTTLAAERWLVNTGQAETLTHRTDSCPPLADGTLVHAALDHGDLDYARELAAWYFRENLVDATSELRRTQRSTTVEIGGVRRSAGELTALTKSAETASERSQAAEALRLLSSELRAARQTWLKAHAAAVHRLGFDTHGSLVRALHPSADRWIEHARDWLSATRHGYLEEARSWRERDGMTSPALSDPRLVAARAVVPAGTPPALAAVQSTMRTWELAEETRHVLVDDVGRPGKLGFAFCSAVSPPSDIRVSVVDGRSLGHYATLLHEFGHALHFSAGMTQPLDLWRLPTAMSEAFGFLLERLVRQPAWQEQQLGAALREEDVERTRFGREHVRRVVAASLCFEMTAHDGAADPATEYRRLYEREFGVSVDGGAAWDRLQTYLEGQPCYPLVYHQAFTTRDRLWTEAVGVAGERWYTSRQGGRAVRSVLGLLDRVEPDDVIALSGG